MTEQNRIRNEIQDKAVLLSLKNDKLLLQFATGVGKSLAALKIIKAAIMAGDFRVWHIVVWESKHIKNWNDDIIKHDMEDILQYVHIYCYASLKSQATGDVNYICDEGHHMFGEVAWEHLTNNVAYRLLVLTATLSADKLKILKQEYPDLVRYSISLSEAIRLELLPKPNIYVIPVGFDNTVAKYEIVITKGAKAKWEKLPQTVCNYGQHWQYLKGATVVNLKIMATAAQALSHYNSAVEYNKNLFIKNRQDYQKVRWLQSGTVRKRFLAEVKTDIARGLDTRLRALNMRKIVFCGSVDQAIELGEKKNTIHSRITTKQSQEIVNNFNDLKITELYTNKMAREGMNLELIQLGVIIQLDAESLGFIQMMGRVLRANNPHIFILVAQGTQDDKYFNSSTLGIDLDLFSDYREFFKLYENGKSTIA